MVTREFGALLIPFSASFGGVTIEPVEYHEEVVKSILSIANLDGFFYPPTVQTWEASPKTGKPTKRIKNTQRPATVYHLPVTHTLCITNPVATNVNFEDGGVLIHLLSFLFGARLQFSEWRIDGRVPTKIGDSNLIVSENTAAHFLEFTYFGWRMWAEELRQRFVNILYVYARAKSLEWDWDSFLWQYTTFDALYKLFADMHGKRADSHPARFNLVCAELGLKYDQNTISAICKARRLLVHEAMWNDATIGHSFDNQRLHDCLARFNARFIAAIVGYKNEFTQSTWTSMGCFPFDKP
ncbi:MAG: hypothetical protein PHI29_10735 [Gallionella sp.]|nr:hypothetical protein [Gallionella sp.]